MIKGSVKSDASMRSGGKSEPLAHIPAWVTIVVILGAGLLTVGAVISKLVPTMLTNGEPMTTAARVYADYIFARNLPLGAMLFLLLAVRARHMLAGFMVLTGLIQIVDGMNDLARGQYLLVPWLLVLALFFLFAAFRLLGQPVWQIGAWRQPRRD